MKHKAFYRNRRRNHNWAVCLLLLLLVSLVGISHSPEQATAQNDPFRPDNPIEILSGDDNFFLKVDLHHPAVQPWVMLAHNDSGGLQPLREMAKTLERHPQWAIINADLFSHGCISGVNCAQGLTYIRGQRKGRWPEYDQVRTIRGNIGFDRWNNVEINVDEGQNNRYMTIGGGPRVLIGGGEPTCYGEIRGNKTFFPASGEWFDDDARWWCNDERSISLIGYSADRRYLYMGISQGRKNVTQVAQWLKERGAFELLRLDSGGSSQMYFNGAYIHGVGSQEDRPIANAFAIIVDINTPMLDTPTNGAVLSSSSVTFRWRNYGINPPHYILQVKDTPDMDAGGTTIVYQWVGGTEYTINFDPQWHNRDLYWSVVAAEAPGEVWARPHHFRIFPAIAP